MATSNINAVSGSCPGPKSEESTKNVNNEPKEAKKVI